MSRAKKIREIVRFSGMVQGVGFRYVTRRTGRGYDVTGYVKNLPDGRVECVVEGTPAEVNAFLKELASEMQQYIRETTRQSAPASGKFHDFDIGY